MRYREEGNDETICNFSNFCESLVFKFGKYILFYFLGIFRIVLILGACAVQGFANRETGNILSSQFKSIIFAFKFFARLFIIGVSFVL